VRHARAAVALLSLTLALTACEQDSPTAIQNPSLEPAASRAVDAGLMAEGQMYSITLENLTPDTGDGGAQVFSPPVLATHRGNGVIYRMHQVASPELAGVAEDALNAPLVEALQGDSRVHQVVEGGGVVPPVATETYTIEAGRGAGRLSLAFMLVNTNDAFAGVNSVRLPRSGRAVYHLHALDAGSEANTELETDIPGPCCGSPGMGTPTYERIGLHEGIQGTGDLDVEKWGWSGPVAVLTIERLN
jgi:hypothetical protein